MKSRLIDEKLIRGHYKRSVNIKNPNIYLFFKAIQIYMGKCIFNSAYDWTLLRYAALFHLTLQFMKLTLFNSKLYLIFNLKIVFFMLATVILGYVAVPKLSSITYMLILQEKIKHISLTG